MKCLVAWVIHLDNCGRVGDQSEDWRRGTYFLFLQSFPLSMAEAAAIYTKFRK